MRFGWRRVVSPASALTIGAAMAVTSAAVAAGVSFSAATLYQAGSDPTAIATADLDGNGHPDLVVANQRSNDVSVLLADGRGAFSAARNFAVGHGPAGVAVGDFNRDGHPDLAVTNFLDATVAVLLGDGRGSFSAPTSFAVGVTQRPVPTGVAVGDFNGDGDPDLAVTNEGAGSA